MMFIFLLLSTIIVDVTFSLSATTTVPSLDFPQAPLVAPRIAHDTNTEPLASRQDRMEVGSPCDGLEGEWNCMVTAFQRCASGRWSIVLDTAYGTVCDEGFTYDFQPAFASWFPPADTTKTIVCTATAPPPGASTDATRPGSSDGAVTAAPHYALWAIMLGLVNVGLLFTAM